MQRGLRVITLQGAIEKSPILLSQYWKKVPVLKGNKNYFVDSILFSVLQYNKCLLMNSK